MTAVQATPVEDQGTQPVDSDKRPRTQRFRRASNAVNLDVEQRRRQARVMASAWSALGSRDAVMAFFNNHDDDLGGRPLDVAVDSDAGLARVEARLRPSVDGGSATG